MRALLSLLLSFVCISVYSHNILSSLNFEKGDWAMIAVPLHNYQLLPVQSELGTFMTKDKAFLTELKQAWDLEVTYDDACDYHYALKFYQNKTLVKTLLLNLHCGYISDEGLSYSFNPTEFERFRTHSEEISWSRISFGNKDVLQKAIVTLSQAPDVYWYDDVDQYQYSGSFLLGLDKLAWHTNLDSLRDVVHHRIKAVTGRQDFYLKQYYHQVKGEELSIRYWVNCEKEFATSLTPFATVPWRPHIRPSPGMRAHGDSVRILAIGVDKQRYFELMRN